MSTSRTGTTKSAWLFLLREGGRWTCADIADELNESTPAVMQMVAAMADGGFVMRYEKRGTGTFLSYGVTASCKVPTGITLAELAECGAVQVEAA